MILSFINIEVVFCTLIICASGYYFLKPSKKHGKNTDKTVLITGCDSGFGKGLVVDNPGAVQSCGCGTSFSFDPDVWNE